MSSIVKKEKMNIVIVGHVDHGKSTVIGRLLADTNSLPKGKLEHIKRSCELNSKPFEYAFLLDALKDEQAQGITIDTARIFFKTKLRDYIILDAPGHIEFLKNMITGASRAEAALLVIDAKEGIQENSKRHGYMLSMLGIKQVVVLINKMDLVDYDQDVFLNIKNQYLEFLQKINVVPLCFIPVSGIEGDNISTSKSDNMKWFQGNSVLEALAELKLEQKLDDKPFRMPIQDIYKFTRFNDDRRIVAGSIDSGLVSIGDEVLFSPSGKRSVIKTIEAFNSKPLKSASAGKAIGFTLEKQIYVSRGEIASLSSEKKPQVSNRFKVNLFWLGKKSLECDKEYLLKVGTNKVSVKVEKIERVIDASCLEVLNKKNVVERHDVAVCILKTKKTIAFDLIDEIAPTSRFVIVDNYEICGGGIITEKLDDSDKWIKEKVFLRNYKWEQSSISIEKRNERYNQKSALIIITGKKDCGKKTLARKLENKLFENGKIVYFLGIGNVLYGVDADIKDRNIDDEYRSEHLRRLSEVSNILLDAGVILIITAIEIDLKDLDIIKTSLNYQEVETIWIGNEVSTDIESDLIVRSDEQFDESVEKIKCMMQDKGIIYKPW